MCRQAVAVKMKGFTRGRSPSCEEVGGFQMEAAQTAADGLRRAVEAVRGQTAALGQQPLQGQGRVGDHVPGAELALVGQLPKVLGGHQRIAAGVKPGEGRKGAVQSPTSRRARSTARFR